MREIKITKELEKKLHEVVLFPEHTIEKKACFFQAIAGESDAFLRVWQSGHHQDIILRTESELENLLVSEETSLYVAFYDDKGYFKFDMPVNSVISNLTTTIKEGWRVITRYNTNRHCLLCDSYSWHSEKCPLYRRSNNEV